MGASVGDRWARVGAEYAGWLLRQPLSANTKRTYRTRASQFLEYLAAAPAEYDDPLEDLHARNYAARDYKSYLKTVRKAKPSSVNLSLAAIDNFYLFLGMGRPEVRREELAQASPRSLFAEEQKRFLRAVERSSEVRDRAIALLLFYAGLRIGELCKLDVEDVGLSARKGRVVVRSGKGDSYREVVLNSEVREALSGWLAERKGWSGSEERAALFLSHPGGSPRGRWTSSCESWERRRTSMGLSRLTH